MSNTLGKLIGKVRHSFKIKNDDNETVQLTITVDFSTSSDIDVKSWLVANRVIAGQRPWRALSAAELKALNGQTFIANEIGRKVKSRAERIAVYTSMGLPVAMATIAVDNPAKFQTMMDRVNELDESVTVDHDEDEMDELNETDES